MKLISQGMKRSQRVFRYLVIGLTLAPLVVVAAPDYALTKSEQRMLPTYCHVKLSGNPRSAAYKKWESIFGEAYLHMHHYCYALGHLTRAKTKLGVEADYEAGLVIADINYCLRAKGVDNTWKLMPEAYLVRGKAYVIKGNKTQAAQDFLKAVQLKQDYIPGYMELSDLFKSMGDDESAKGYLEQGLKIKPNSKGLNRRYKKITGRTYEENKAPN